MKAPAVVIGLLPLLFAACVTTRTTSTTWGEPGGPRPPDRYGRVVWIRETVQHQHGNPAGGAAVGAVIGGLLGHAVIGRSSGTLFGAVGGAAAGAAASQGSAENRTYQVAVRFTDGEERVFLYRGYTPFRVGEAVTWTPSGLRPQQAPVAAAPPPPPSMPPPPPPYAPPYPYQPPQ